MSIEINSGGVGKGITVDSKNQPKSSSTSEPQVQSKPVASTADKVTMTRQAEQLQKLDELVRNTPDVDQEKVDRIKTQIAEGKFQIDSDAIASRIIQQEQELNR